jgi:hypothetical protein
MGASLLLLPLAPHAKRYQIGDPIVNIKMETIMARTVIAIDIARLLECGLRMCTFTTSK